MIDTIKLFIPITEQETIDKIRLSLSRTRKENLKENTTEYEYYTSNVEFGSYSRTVGIKSTNLPQGFFVEFSVPKYVKGNNVEMLHPDQLKSAIERLYKELCEYVEFELPHFSKWPVYKLDICYNWLLNSEEEAMQALSCIKRIEYPRKKTFSYDTSIMYLGTSYTVKFYMKGPEFRKNDFKKIGGDKAISLLSWANRILRFEVSIKRTYLQDFFGLETVYVDNLTDIEEIEQILVFYLGKVFFYLNLKTMTESEIESILFNKFSKSKATRLYQFYKGFYHDDVIKNMFKRGGLNRSTIYRNKKDLKDAGIGFSIEGIKDGASIFEQLTIPSKTARFDLLDYDDYS